jgi:peroxiredoxin
LRDRHGELLRAGLDTMVVLCQKREKVAAWLASHPLPFPILIDEDRSRAKRWGVYVAINFESIHMARAASFVVDRAGIVRYARIAKHQLDPAPIGSILAASLRARANE